MATDVMTRPNRTTDEDRASGVLVVIGMAIAMWFVEIVDVVAGDLDSAGIRPRDAEGLVGILTAPFLHGGFGHLIGNTLPFVVLGIVIALGGLLRVLAVTAIVAVAAGLGTWLTATEGTVHIGASGLVFGYTTYLVSRGLYSRRVLHLAVGLIVFLLYGTTLLFGLVPTPGVSWQGHLFGAIGGIIAAWAVHGRRDEAPPARTPQLR